jgi:hypothetical protein
MPVLPIRQFPWLFLSKEILPFNHPLCPMVAGGLSAWRNGPNAAMDKMAVFMDKLTITKTGSMGRQKPLTRLTPR